jgi:hypothetical protein
MLSKAETKALYNKISKVYDLMSEHREGRVRQVDEKQNVRMWVPVEIVRAV